MAFIYKILTQVQWQQAQEDGVFLGASIDIADGFIHFSTAAQVAETANKHFKGQDNLWLLQVDEAKLGQALRYEVSRGGALFPHLYATLDCQLIENIWPFNANDNGIFSIDKDLL
ncbi:DUF952 domain-containing protein [Bartonella sp. HY761]|uniref:DUF952 domain-containing protein n=1 Tax=Bartonella sp. HY761 TaxID=2979330 RepID=UPI0021FF3DAF|nr:DUF952 domain-containing protein [Bartonella sp. HY761]UXN05853.1 DUF952 domain-containing protein [Bartonella sp. HY761]